MAPVRFAILGDPRSLEPWQLRCLAQLKKLEFVIPVAWIVTLTRRPAHAACRTEDVGPDDWSTLPALTLDASHDSATVQTLAQIRNLEVDFVLAWPEQHCPTSLLDAASWGVWRYQFGDWQHFRGNPPGFWEVYEGHSVSVAMLVRLQPDPDSVVVLREACLRTELLSWRGNRLQLQAWCANWAAQLCTDIRNGALEQFSQAPRGSQARVRRPPTLVQTIIYATRVVTRAALTAARMLFCHEQWSVGVVDQPIAAFLDSTRRAPTRWVVNPKPSELFADPFGIVRDGRLTLLCEYLHYGDNRGTIVAVDPTGAVAPVEIGPHPAVHLSYPCLLDFSGRLLCIPETHEAREIALYEVERFPDRWKKLTTLVANTLAVDATPFRHGELWWLAASAPAPNGANCELHLWHASDIGGPWEPHPSNPVKIDVRSSRPAGTPFVRAGVLYRPAQDCSSTYGGRTIINRVVKLTPTSFREEFAAAVNPEAAGPYPEGLHTLSAVGSVTLIDGKRTRFVPAQFRRTLRGWLRGALKHLT